MSSHSEFKTALTSYLFIITPFLILILVKLLTGRWEDLLLTGDWSIASAMIYSSSIVTVRSATRTYKGSINGSSLDWFMSVTIVMACLSIATYVVALMQPSYWIGVVQIVLFVVASKAHIKYSRAAMRLKNQLKTQ